MVRRVIGEALRAINQNADTHMETVNQESFNENQVDGQYGVPSSIEMHHHNFQYEPINFLFPTESSQENISLEKHQIESVDDTSFPISTEMDLCNESQTYPLDLDSLRFDWEEHTSSELESRNEDYAIEQPSCSNNFSSKLNVGNSPNHTVEESNTCKICNRKFRFKYFLNRHMLVHTGEKPFSCGVCNKQFSQSGNLHVHMLIQIGEKTYICDICKREFTQRCSLKRHMLTHVKPKVF